MTEIHLHGILGQKYGKLHKFSIKEPKDVIRALEANYEDFNKDLKDLLRKNIVYTIVADDQWIQGNSCSRKNKIKKIDFTPCILGSGILVLAGVAAKTAALVWAVVSAVVSIANAVYSYIQAGKQSYPEIPGATATSSANSRSLSFSNRENIEEQGNPVPLVYGRIKIGSAVIQSSVKSFPLTLTLADEFLNSTEKKSANQVAVVTSQGVDVGVDFFK
jgi:predicted phage tail protein